MRYLTVDGMMSGTGIRDSVEGGYIEISDLGLSESLTQRLASWLLDYEAAHFDQYRDATRVADLDEEGLEICSSVRDEISDAKVRYYSDALTRELSNN